MCDICVELVGDTLCISVKCVAVCCSVLQCFAVCCSVLQCVAVWWCLFHMCDICVALVQGGVES